VDNIRPPLPTGGYAVPSVEQYDQQPAAVSQDEASKAASELSGLDTATMLYARYSSMKDLEARGGTKLSPDEANQRFPDMPVPFREPINPLVAQFQFDQFQDRQKLAEKIAMGPQDAWSRTKTWGNGLLSHLMDPVEFGAGTLIGWGAGAVVGTTGAGASLMARGGLMSAEKAAELGLRTGNSFLARTAFNAIEAGTGNLVQNAGQEVATAKVATMEGQQYDPVEGLMNVGVSTFAGTVFGVGLKEASFRLGNAWNRMLKGTSPEADLPIARAVVGNLENDIRPDATPLLEGIARETDVNPKDFGLPEYHYEPVEPGHISDRKFYVPTKDASLDFKTGEKLSTGDDFGMGVQLTDNPGVANAAASRSLSDAVGAVHEVEFQGELKPVFENQVLPENLREQFRAELASIGEKDAKSMVDDMSTKDILKTIQTAIDEGDLPPERMQVLAEEMRRQGYNALVDDGSTHMGVEHSPHNKITVLDESLLKQKATFEPEPSVINVPDQEHLESVAARQSDLKSHTLFDDEKFKKIEARIQEMDTEASYNPTKMHQETEEMLKEVEDLVKQKLMTPSELAELKAIREEISFKEIENKLVKAAIGCVGA
jgi:hypothetical protein